MFDALFILVFVMIAVSSVVFFVIFGLVVWKIIQTARHGPRAEPASDRPPSLHGGENAPTTTTCDYCGSTVPVGAECAQCGASLGGA